MLKILEAILKGILMGLEIQDGELDLPTFLKSKVTSDYHVARADNLRWVRENFVDLGLPSGTLWCKYNLGATCRSTPKSWYGYCYMWGSTKPNDKDICKWENTPFNGGNSEYDENYIRRHIHEVVDNNGVLYPEYDAAYLTDNRMQMPTAELFQELSKHAEHHWVNDYNRIKGLNGVLFTGKNGNTLFIPAAGERIRSKRIDAGYSCNLSSSSLYFDSISSAHSLYFNRNGEFMLFINCRCNGSPVRGVLKRN